MNLNVIDEETIRVSDNVHYEVTKLGTHHICLLYTSDAADEV